MASYYCASSEPRTGDYCQESTELPSDLRPDQPKLSLEKEDIPRPARGTEQGQRTRDPTPAMGVEAVPTYQPQTYLGVHRD